MSEIRLKKTVSVQGNELILFELRNKSGSVVEILNYGATLVSALVPDKEGRLENVVLRYDQPEDYLTDTAYLGSTVGRFANRISNACFELNGQTFFLDKNDGENSNHGGFNGFNKKYFDYRIEGNSLILFTRCRDGEGGFPGNLHFSVTYTFSEMNELNIQYKAVSDQVTVFNPTNHAYFDLSAGKGIVLDHELFVSSDYYLEMNDKFLPTGNICSLTGTAFDFSSYKKISGLMPLKNEILKGYNTYFIGSKTAAGNIRMLASLRENHSGRMLQVYSDMPGVQFYTGDYLSGAHEPLSGLCLEAQFYPDAPNHESFPSCVIYPEKEVIYNIQYRFL